MTSYFKFDNEAKIVEFGLNCEIAGYLFAKFC